MDTRAVTLAVTLGIHAVCAGCGRREPARPAEPPPAPIQPYSRFAAGDELAGVIEALNLDEQKARYNESLPPDQMGVVYFLKEGNVRISARKAAGHWVLAATPFLERSEAPIEQRLAEWDRGADRQQDFGLKGRK